MENALDKFLGQNDENTSNYLKMIEDMMGNYAKYKWAESTLIGIYDFINENHYITEGQMKAVNNIKNAHIANYGIKRPRRPKEY